MAGVQSVITKHIEDFFQNFQRDRSEVTFRMIKDALAPKIENWDEVVGVHKDFMKEEARRLATETPTKESVQSAFKTPGKLEREQDMEKTTKKQVKSANSNKRKKLENSESNSSDSSSENSPGESEALNIQKKKKIAKMKEQGQDSSRKKKSSTESSRTVSGEVMRLKDLAKKLGVNVPVNVYKGSPSNDALEERLGEFLRSQGLSSLKPGPREISQLRNKVRSCLQ